MYYVFYILWYFSGVFVFLAMYSAYMKGEHAGYRYHRPWWKWSIYAMAFLVVGYSSIALYFFGLRSSTIIKNSDAWENLQRVNKKITK